MSSVDVIVPCYRYGHFLRQCVESVLTQTGINVRVLIIDDASPDNTAEIASDLAKDDSRITFVRHVTNKGHIATFNEGIEWASADYLLILSADDYLLPGALCRSVNLMDAHPEVGFVFGNVIRLDEAGTTKPLRTFTSAADESDWRILSGSVFIELSGSTSIVWTPTAVVRTKLQKRLGEYRPELPHSADMEMWLRFAAFSSVGFLEAYQAVYRRHSGNMSLNYMTKNCMAGVQQRKAALDCFLQFNSFSLPDAGRIRHKLFWSLGCETIELASAAFNIGEVKVSDRLSEFAFLVCPEVKRSLPWAKLAFKRLMGKRAWCALQPVVAVLRMMVLSVKDSSR